MSCELVHSTIHGYFDGELDAVHATEFERHLESCSECQAALENMESLRTQLREADLYERASPHFREQIRMQLRPGAAARTPAMSWRRSFLIPAFATLTVAGVFLMAWYLMLGRADTAQITAELIDAHVRSLQVGHLTDVKSTDQHTVKPWFDGKLDFIPPVSDYPEQGFLLIGGRLDIIDGHSVAAVVYARRQHIINLFVWPAQGKGAFTVHSGSRQGYNWTRWRSGDMQCWLVSDVSAADLRELQELIR